MVHLEDLRQECWLWVFGHRDTVAELLERSDAYLIRRLRGVAERYARREKALRGGYSPADEEFYSLSRITELLPDALDPYAMPSQTKASEITGKSELYMEWETSLADIRAAFEKLDGGEQQSVRGWVFLNMPEPTPQDVTSALRKMQRALGGPRPDGGNK